MSNPMFKITSDSGEAPPKVVANLLPCRVQHDGPIDTVQPFWQPKTQDNKNVAFFRGRELHGKTVKLPTGYRGVVVDKVPDAPDAPKHVVTEIDDETDEVRDVPPAPSSMRVRAEFDEVVVWGHEALADAASDPYVRSVEEWLQVSAHIHAYPETQAAST
ncbi:ribonuclease H2 non-catalytic subunit-domain-containing protein [Plectosphaerella plurivora]|uniref:Ribonuclease H2 non-catalytic subunit-domain-containing protein n=1 Tax=Plectosphaerella plurivora TaxID=936078 RepID=A0A9P9A7J1_9PEZI|nr:ribonuclease H2 non-catalytic subunit-domain-containing protein [Plectosphaerella plurivora]